MPFSLRMAARFLKASKTQTIFIIIGIAVGVSVQVFVGSLIQSLQKSLVNSTVGNSPQVTVLSTQENDRIQGWEDMVQKIRDINGVTNVTTAADGQVYISNFTKATVGLIRGFNLTEADGIFHFIPTIYAGRLPENVNEVLVGKDLATTWNLSVGDHLIVFKNASLPSDTNELVISGFYDLGVAAVNNLWLITSFDTANSTFSFYDNVTSINVQVADVFAADTIASQINATLTLAGDNVKVTNWKTENSDLLSGLQGQSLSSYMIQAFVLISVLLGIASILAITVIQKSRQIGILKAMGATDRDASLIFLFQGLILGLGGALLGVLLGYGLLYSFTTFAVNPVTNNPIIAIFIDYGFLAISGTVALLSAVAASLVSARRSSKLSVIEVIRNG